MSSRSRMTAVRVSNRRLAVLVAALGFVALVLLDALIRDEIVPRGDDSVTEKMAEAPFAAHTFPFAYRIAIPWLVHVMPFSHSFSFSLLAWLCSAAAGGLLFLLLTKLGFSRPLSVALALTLIISPPLLIASLRQGRSHDPMTVLVMMAGALSIVERRVAVLAATMAVGVLNRESALFLAPWAYAVWANSLWDRAAARKVVLAALPAIGFFVALRFAIPVVGREQVIGYSSALGGRWDVLVSVAHNLTAALRRLFTTFGPLWLLAPFALRDWSYARRGLVLIGVCGVALTFAQDWARIMLVAAPVIYPAAAWTIRHSRSLQVATVVAWLAVIIAYAVYMQTSGVEKGIINNPLPAYPVR